MSQLGRLVGTTFVLAFVLGVAAAQAGILYLVEDPGVRLWFGMGLLVVAAWPIALGAAILGRTRQAEQPVVEEPDGHRRQFGRLRRWVAELLRDIRRLNWLVFDMERGLRNREQAIEEIRTLEDRLFDIIEEVKTAAGQVDERGHTAEILAFRPRASA